MAACDLDQPQPPTDTPKTGHKRQRIDHLVQQRVTNEATVREAWDEVFFKSLGFSLAGLCLEQDSERRAAIEAGCRRIEAGRRIM